MKQKLFFLSILFFLIDFVSKRIIENTMKLYESIKIIPNFFNITYVVNDGAAFSILSGKQIFLIILGIGVLLFLIYSIQKEKLTTLKIIYYSLLIGGILGNLFDRILFNGVKDFLDFKIFVYDAPVFNLADTFIFIGVVLIIIENIIGGENGIFSRRR